MMGGTFGTFGKWQVPKVLGKMAFLFVYSSAFTGKRILLALLALLALIL
jgi:hypothetical protein